MVSIQLGTTKSSSALLAYSDKRAEVAHGLNCDPETAKVRYTMAEKAVIEKDQTSFIRIIG